MHMNNFFNFLQPDNQSFEGIQMSRLDLVPWLARSYNRDYGRENDNEYDISVNSRYLELTLVGVLFGDIFCYLGVQTEFTCSKSMFGEI